MKPVLAGLFLVFACTEIYATPVPHDVFDVTSMAGSEDSYLKLKRERASLRRPSEEKLRHKEKVCEAILAGDFFDAFKVHMVNPNHKSIYKQLKREHPDIHDEHFKSAEETFPKFANPYKPRDVNVHGKIIREYMFTCLARNYSTNYIGQYFVSPKYHVNEGAAAKTIRFVFAYNNKKEVVLLAKAELKAVISSQQTTPAKTSVNPTQSTPSQSSDDDHDEDEEDSSYDEDKYSDEEEDTASDSESW